MQPLLKKNKITVYLLEESKLTGPLEKAICQGLTACFPNDTDIFETCSWWHSRPAWRIIALTEADTVAGHIAVVERPITVGNIPLTVQTAGIQSVFVIPDQRGTGLAAELMRLLIQHAEQRATEAGLLFCIPELEKVYAAMGWQKINAPAYMQDTDGNTLPLPSKNITMIYPLNHFCFPPETINLNGPDW